MGELGGIMIAVGVTLLLGFAVGSVLNRYVPKPSRPEYFDQATWDAMYEGGKGGSSIGIVERLICLMSIWVREYVILAGYLAFKVAAKWEVWRNVIQVPDRLQAVTPPADSAVSRELAWYQVRLGYGSWLLSRFIVGTALSVIAAAIGAYTGKHIGKLLIWLRSVWG